MQTLGTNTFPILGKALEQIFIKDDSVSFFHIKKNDRNPSGLWQQQQQQQNTLKNKCVSGSFRSSWIQGI